jgi:hypothetical protein
MAREELEMGISWPSFGLGAVAMLVVTLLIFMALGFWAWATNKREMDAQDIDNDTEEAKYVAPYPNQVSSVVNRSPAPPLAAVHAGIADGAGHPVPQLGVVDHHRTRPRRSGR